jgi:hypothetical protein
MSNVIINDFGDIIGYYSDLVKEIKEDATKSLTANEYEQVRQQLEVLEMLDEWTDTDGLLIISEHNGMGLTVEQYKGDK